MQYFINFIVKFKEYFAFVALVIISLSLISMGSVSKIGGLRTIMIGTMGQLQGIFSWIPNPASVRSENRALRELNLQLSTEVTRMRQSLLENQRLKKMLNFAENSEFELLSCEIVGKSSVEMRNYITVNKGYDFGIKKGMIARTDAGIVGIVVTVSDKYSLVELVANRNVRISATIVRNNIDGIVSWQGEDYFLINNIPNSFDVIPGDEVVTSNYSNKYPPDVPIGLITKIEEDKSSMFKKITMRSYVNFQTLEQLFIVKFIADEERQRLLDEIEKKLQSKRNEK